MTLADEQFVPAWSADIIAGEGVVNAQDVPKPMSLEDQIISIFALTKGYGRGVPVDQIQTYAGNLLQFMKTSHPEIGQAIASQKAISKDLESVLKAALAEYNQSQGYEIPSE